MQSVSWLRLEESLTLLYDHKKIINLTLEELMLLGIQNEHLVSVKRLLFFINTKTSPALFEGYVVLCCVQVVYIFAVARPPELVCALFVVKCVASLSPHSADQLNHHFMSTYYYKLG